MGVIVIYFYVEEAYFCDTFLYKQKYKKHPFYVRSFLKAKYRKLS